MSGNGRTNSPRCLPTDRLTDEQRRLVRENVGLVGVHLRRHVGKVLRPRREREWEDLFQEGCLGLIQAALRYREERGIPFAAFALPRIHNAVSRALRCKFSTVRLPPPQNGKGGGVGRKVHGCLDASRIRSLSGELGQCFGDGRCREPGEPTGDTIGRRLRDKYERAVRLAAGKVSRTTSTRGDRDALVRILVDERLLVPHEDSRRALRQIARDTNSSFARVAQCDKQLGDAVRDTLEADPEFLELRRRARSSPDGTGVPIDADLEHELAALCAREFVHRFQQASAIVRARMLDGLLSLPGSEIDDVLRGRVARLSPTHREILLRSGPQDV